MIGHPHKTPPRRSSFRPRGFTLLEILVATAMFAVLVGAVFSVFYAALGMRERAYIAFEADLPKAYVAEIIRRDLANTVVPSGLLAGEFIGEKDENRSLRVDRLDFHTASGIVDDRYPWGDIQKVEYYLEKSKDLTAQVNEESWDLARAVTRNLLASTTEEPEMERLLGGVQSLEFTYYDGEDWVDSWDSTTQENVAPDAIRVQITFLPTEAGERQALPIELVVPIVTKAPVSQEEGATASSPTPPDGGR